MYHVVGGLPLIERQSCGMQDRIHNGHIVMQLLPATLLTKIEIRIKLRVETE